MHGNNRDRERAQVMPSSTIFEQWSMSHGQNLSSTSGEPEFVALDIPASFEMF